ncbi:glycoside hydrolase superfamily [Panaeolus papilionaceus]|nr:glycoside hydrolase superfamily [Panaeolus papilionaceus]
MFKLLPIVILAVSLQYAEAAVPLYGQCGGQGYSGETTCASGAVCTYSNPWYSQCLPGSGGGNPTTTQQNPQPTGNPGSGSGLHAKFVSKTGKKFWGTCADANLINNSANAAVIKSDFGQVTPENSMKWDALESSRGKFNWGGADTLVNWAVSNGKLIRGHTLVWHAQLPTWVQNINNRDTLTTVIQDHIKAVAGRYAGKLYGWDVVNEILNENGTLRSSVFGNVLGESFVTIAFRAARQYDPHAKLYINDYNLDSNNAKAQGTVALVKRVNQAGKLIDGIGTQMHLGPNGAGGALAALQALASAGVQEVAITELDITGAASNDYLTVLNACRQVSTCVGITSWGVSDKDSWRSRDSPLLFDGNYRPKAAYNALISALS